MQFVVANDKWRLSWSLSPLTINLRTKQRRIFNTSPSVLMLMLCMRRSIIRNSAGIYPKGRHQYRRRKWRSAALISKEAVNLRTPNQDYQGSCKQSGNLGRTNFFRPLMPDLHSFDESVLIETRSMIQNRHLGLRRQRRWARFALWSTSVDSYPSSWFLSLIVETRFLIKHNPSVARACARSSIYLFVCSFIHSFLRPFAHSFSCSFVHMFARPFICSFVERCIKSFPRWLAVNRRVRSMSLHYYQSGQIGYIALKCMLHRLLLLMMRILRLYDCDYG